ncbi:hypothetical protein [Bradyrhizobium sp. ORS 86]|uniref:hypothetical protein n=1 Tax=Bradyrhizobium sp. ORS 86 TaxID=1685970 RepID=UPI00388E4D1F
MALLKTKPPEKSLAERIAEFRSELDAWIDAKAAELKEDTPGVPVGVLRNLLTARAGACQCQAVQDMLEGK